MIFRLFQPKKIYHSVFEISLEDFRQAGIRGIIIDLDNTLTEWQNPKLPQDAVAWLEKVMRAGLRICFVSNNSIRRVEEVAARLGLPFIAHAQKPRRKSFRHALAIMNTYPEETAVIGDQIFTDILGGNRLGLYTILVSPLSRQEFIGTRFVRLLETIILCRQR